MGKAFVPATGLLIGCAVKIVLNIVLIRQPEINIYGAAISSVACQMVSFTVCFTVLARNLTLKFSFTKYIFKPLLSGGVMGVFAVFGYKAMIALTGSNIVSTIVTIIFAALVYFAMVFALKILSESEIASLPMGKKILSALKKTKIYK